LGKKILDQALLKKVSRSFYLTLKALPLAIRNEIGVAYLLARCSDTLADSVEVSDHMIMLQWFKNLLIQNNENELEDFSNELARKGYHQLSHEGEAELMRRVKEVFDLFDGLNVNIKILIRLMILKIIHGQEQDLLYFESNKVRAVKSFKEWKQLRKYTYRVAGCVGEFWFKLVQLKMPEAMEFKVSETWRLHRSAIEYGMALQMVNIVNDVSKDKKLGRCYLPLNEDFGEGKFFNEVHERVWGEVRKEAAQRLERGRYFLESIQSRRLLFATALPLRIAEENLLLLDQVGVAGMQARVKVSRWKVYKVLMKTALSILWTGRC
jgi:farnesyl-diphosphate farnesyltransferase